MLGKTPNKVYDPFLKAELGYKNPERLKKVIAAQPKMYDGEKLHSTKLVINLPNSEGTLEDAEENSFTDTISELKNKLKTVDKGKNVNTKFEKSEALGTLLCVTPLPKNIAIKANKVSNSKVNADRSKPVTSHPTPTNEQGVKSSNSVRRQKSKDTKSKNRVLKNTKSSSANVWKTSSSASLDSNKCETKNSNVCQTNECVSSSKTVKACVNAVNDGSNIVWVSYGKYVFSYSYEKCVARNALTRNSSVKRALFTTPVAAKSKNLVSNYVVAKSRLSVVQVRLGMIISPAITGFGDYVKESNALVTRPALQVLGRFAEVSAPLQFCSWDRSEEGPG
ncbi:hypothetical protein Tco_1058084 [Tanacetum coccineum]|uniref:Uncharacterized protein n=1 Tax=Tanacetum coccineum TaxID=301880 RepID=A0ABQ5H913_9ASTR